MDEYEDVEILRAPDAKLIQELSLVLNSVGIPHRVVGNQHQRWIVVPSARSREALEELANYHRENLGRDRRHEKLVVHGGAVNQAILWAAILALFHVMAHGQALGIDWKEIGRVDAAAMASGEIWRGFTALSLHADLNHLASNLFLGALWIALLSQVIGPAAAWLSVLLAGGTANLLNAAIVGPDLRSLGASTAVFAALGALTAVQFSRKLTSAAARATRWIPVVAGIALLGWNGMGSARIDPWQGVQREPDDNTDVGAHVAGFVCGCAFGLLAYYLERRGTLAGKRRELLAWVAPVLFAAAWGLAVVTR